ncbi:EAL domain-containing protein [Nocardioides mesophilus]|uniref:EAL domain-containing protein n=1 Tax=Nocardioides mesophilus TaxID=433659 RepID=A0A7G9REV2_9ACTN|nr:EAL domain-containing protein [Nocardioides mesophilus]QNN54127.1 EAL domain-containing protein [Nocardioides mesophilus]
MHVLPAPVDGVEADLLGAVHELVLPDLRRHVARSYAAVPAGSGAARVRDRLTPAELDHLERTQAEHLQLLLDPATDLLELTARSREVGRIHAMVGVEMDWYAAAAAEHQRAVFTTLELRGDVLDSIRAGRLVSERFMTDLRGVLQGYRDVEVAQGRVLVRVGRAVTQSRTLPDLVRGVLEGISVLEGIVAVFISRPDDNGCFLFEAGAGDGVEELIAWTHREGTPVMNTSPDSPLGQGPSARAWRSGEIAVADAYLTDPTTRPWIAWAERFGWRSSAAVPLCDAAGTPHALLSLYAAWPGYFSYETRAAMLEQVKSVVERALTDLEGRPDLAAGVQAYGDRALHLSRLAAGEVEMVFQPIVSLPEGELLKLEALARLRDGDRLVPPAEFLPAFGDDELLRLFEVGLEDSLTALEEWERQGLVTSVSVNMPVVSAHDQRYLTTVAEALARHRVDPSRLMLELLETGHMLGSLVARKAGLDAFKRLGVGLAQDDLGSGYSSLLRMRHFDFDVVKIDQSLIRGTPASPRTALQFVQPITDIAHSLGLHVTLEGLETPGLIEAAVQLGVDSGQGYGIARPMRRADVAGWARRYAVRLDRERPTTSLGALAAHVAWEHRVTAVGASSSARAALVASDACALRGFLVGGDQGLQTLHEQVHLTALDGRGPVHRVAWERLVVALDEV